MSFNGFLKQSTAVDILLGPFVDEDDGKTAEVSLTISQADVLLSKNGQALAQKSNVNAATHDSSGFYNCELDTTDTNTVGQLTVVVYESGALPVRHEYHVVEEAVYDAMYGASAVGPVLSTEDGSSFTTLATAAALATVDGIVDTILVDTAELQGDWTDGGRLDLIVDGILTDTAEIGVAGAGLTNIDLPDQTMNITGNITGNLSGSVGSVTGAVGSVTAEVSADVTKISGSAEAADNLEASAETIVTAAAAAGTLSTTQMTTTLTEATDDHYNGRIIIWTSGVLQDQATDITDYDGATKMLTFTAVTEAPSDSDTFNIV